MRGDSISLTGVILETLSALLDGTFAELTWDEKLNCRLHVLRRQSRLLAVDDQHASLGHETVKRVGHNRVHRLHRLLRDFDLLLVRADLLEDAKDVGVEGMRVTADLRALRRRCLLLLQELTHSRPVDLLLFISGDDSCLQKTS